jgi:opacity protein-like surface antigen
LKFYVGEKMNSIVLLLSLAISVAEAKPTPNGKSKTAENKTSSSNGQGKKKSSSSTKSSKSKTTETTTNTKTVKINPNPTPKSTHNQSRNNNVGKERRPEVKDPIPSTKPSNPKYGRVDTNVHRSNVGKEHRPEVKDPIPSTKPSNPKYGRVDTNVHRNNVGKEHRPEVKDPIPSTKPSNPKYGRVDTNVHRNPGPTTKKVPEVIHKSSQTPQGWNPQYHRVQTPTEYSSFDPRRWGAGYVYYNPPKKKSIRVVNTNKGRKVSKGYRPLRSVDRNHQLSLGGRGVTYRSGYVDGGDYIDPGIGLAIGYRPVEALGAEISYSHFSQNIGENSDRKNAPVQAVGQVYLFPWTRVSPFASVGYAWNQVDIDDHYHVDGEGKHAEQSGVLAGPVFGAGVELNVTKNLGLKTEARYLQYNNISETDLAKDNGLILSGGITLYF